MSIATESLVASPPPPEVERLLNPAYCASVLAQYAYAYGRARSESTRGLPYVLLYLCLPMALHSRTCEEINRHNKAYGLHRVVRERPDLLVGLDERVRGLAGTARAAFLFGANSGMLSFDREVARVLGNPKLVRKLRQGALSEEAIQPIRAAERLGAWFGHLAPAEVFLHLGLQP